MDKKLVQMLRKATGAGLHACMDAAQASNGDFDQALQVLKEKGRLLMSEKSIRLANEGVVCVLCSENKRYAVMLELNCETDFVANNEFFVNLASNIAKNLLHVVMHNNGDKQNKSLHEDAYNNMTVNTYKVNDTTLTTRFLNGDLNELNNDIKELIGDATLKLRERVQLSKCIIYNLEGSGFVTFYLHNKSKTNSHTGRLGVLLAVAGSDWDSADQDLRDRAYKVSMHVAAMQPLAIEREQLENELVDRKTLEIKKSSDLEKKPDNIAEKILSGKMNKFYQEVVLMEQLFVMNDEKSVSAFWQEKHTDKDQYSIICFDFFKVET